MEASPYPLSSRPGFPVTQHRTRQRVRLSVRKGACSSSNPPISTGNPGERTRISCYAEPKMTSFAAFIKESRMSFAEPIGLNRKSGAAEGSAVLRTFHGNVFRRSVAQWICGSHLLANNAKDGIHSGQFTHEKSALRSCLGKGRFFHAPVIPGLAPVHPRQKESRVDSIPVANSNIDQ